MCAFPWAKTISLSIKPISDIHFNSNQPCEIYLFQRDYNCTRIIMAHWGDFTPGITFLPFIIFFFFLSVWTDKQALMVRRRLFLSYWPILSIVELIRDLQWWLRLIRMIMSSLADLNSCLLNLMEYVQTVMTVLWDDTLYYRKSEKNGCFCLMTDKKSVLCRAFWCFLCS